MFTDRQKLHRGKLITSAASEEYSYFWGIRPINRSRVQTRISLVAALPS
jgi:hypothetical protein